MCTYIYIHMQTKCGYKCASLDWNKEAGGGIEGRADTRAQRLPPEAEWQYLFSHVMLQVEEVLGSYIMHKMHLVNMKNAGWGTTVLCAHSFIGCLQSVPLNSIIGSSLSCKTLSMSFFLFLTNVGLVVCRVVVAYCQETKHAQKLSQEAETTKSHKSHKRAKKATETILVYVEYVYIQYTNHPISIPLHPILASNPIFFGICNNCEKSPCHHFIHLVLVKSIQTSFLLFWLVPSATHQSDTSSLEDSASSKRADAAWSRINR